MRATVTKISPAL